MYGVLGENDSDVATIKVLIRRLAKNDSLRVKTKGFEGCGQMLQKGASHIRLFLGSGIQRFVVAYDSDGNNANQRREEVMAKIARPAGVVDNCCIVVPVQEIEAWILADIEAVSNIFDWKPKEILQPELISSPKEHLEKLSLAANKKPRYSHSTHNEQVAKHLRLDLIRQRCPSFRPLSNFITAI